MGNIFRNFRIGFFIFVIIGFSIPILSSLSEYIANPSIYQDRKVNMKMEYENVKPPLNATKVKETINSKVTRIWAGTDYTLEMGKDNIEKYYQGELQKNGWKYEKIDHDGVVYFKKNDLLFAVRAENNRVHTGIYYDGPGPNF